MQPMSQPIEGAEARDRRRRGRKRSGRRSRLTQDPQIIHRSKAREGSQQTNVAGCGLVVVVVVRRRRERRSEYRSRSAFSWNSTMRPMGQWVLLQGRREVVGGSKLGRSNRVLVSQTSCRHNRVCDTLGIGISPEAGVPAVRMGGGGSLRERSGVPCVMDEWLVRIPIEGGYIN